MGDALTGDLLDADRVERHEELLRRFIDGFTGMCHALHDIRAEKTYEVQGCSSWREFLETQHISESNGRLMANAWPVLYVLQQRGLHEYVKHVDVLRPITRMPDPKQQVRVIELAINVAKKQMIPFSAKVVRDVAEKNFGWIPESKYAKGERRRSHVQEHDPTAELREDLERAFRVIANCGVSGYDLAQIFDLDDLDCFYEALTVMQDAREA